MILLLLILLAFSSSYAAPFEGGFGLNVKYVQGEPFDQSAKDMLLELRVKWVRDAESWNTMQVGQGVLAADFTPAFKARLQFYKDNNIGVMFFGVYNAAVYSDDPAYANDRLPAVPYGDYMLKCAQLLKASGVKFVMEVWNEPRTFFVLPWYGGQWNGAEPSPWLDHYVEMANQTVAKIKAFDPSISVIVQDDLYVTHYWYLENNNPTLDPRANGSSIHPYTNGPMDWTPFAADTNWTLGPWGTIVDADQTTTSAMRKLRERWQLKSGHQPDLWITEIGWSQGDAASADKAAKYLPRAFMTSAASGLKGLFWFSSIDRTDGPMGLRMNDGTKRPAYIAWKTMVQQLGGHEFISQTIDPQNNWAVFTEFRKISDGTKKMVIVGADPPSTAAYHFQNGETGTAAVNYLGNPVPITDPLSAGDGPIYVTIQRPIQPPSNLHIQ